MALFVLLAASLSRCTVGYQLARSEFFFFELVFVQKVSAPLSANLIHILSIPVPWCMKHS